MKEIRKISLAIAESVATKAYEMNLAQEKRPRDLRSTSQKTMYQREGVVIDTCEWPD